MLRVKGERERKGVCVGLALQVHWRALFLTYALLTNRTMTRHSDKYNFAIGSLCKGDREPCYFGPLSGCPETSLPFEKLSSVAQQDRVAFVSGRVSQAFGSDAYIWPEEMFPREVGSMVVYRRWLARLKTKTRVSCVLPVVLCLRCFRRTSFGRSVDAGIAAL